MTPDLTQQFSTVLKQNKERIFRICRSYATDEDEAKDLFQEVTINLWKALPSFRKEAEVNTWVYRITLNVCIRNKQNISKRKNNEIRLESIYYENIQEPELAPQQQEQLQRLSQCISKLEATDKSIILLYLEELSYKEISHITGLTENHIAVKMKRIKNKLFNCIQS